PQLARGRLLEDGGELPLQLPRVEEELPVDVFAQRRELRLDDPCAGERRRGQVVERQLLTVRARLLDGKERLPLALRVLVAQAFLIVAVLRVEAAAPFGIEQVGDDADDARRIEHV